MIAPSTKAGGLGGEAVDAGRAALLDLSIPQDLISAESGRQRTA